MKQQLLQQMSAMDTLLRENFFTASISALVPGVACMLALGGGLRNLISRVRSRRRSRRSLIKQVCAPPHMPPHTRAPPEPTLMEKLNKWMNPYGTGKEDGK